MTDPPWIRWPRRALSVTLLSLVAALGWGLAPLWLVLLGALDAVTRSRFARVRSVLCFAVFSASELIGLGAATLGWAWTLGRPTARRALDYAIQERWAKALDAALQRIYGFQREVEWVGVRPDPARPQLVLERHTGIVDTLLLIRLFCPEIRLRYVLKREPLWDPAWTWSGSACPTPSSSAAGDATTPSSSRTWRETCPRGAGS
ncbi:MAG: hypothetical protein R3F62_23175 [Planctomycetota bacterium]